MKTITHLSFYFIWVIFSSSAFAQKITLSHVEPAFWWVGMKNPELKILVHGPGIGQAQVSLSYKGVNLSGIEKVESPNYLFLNLQISPDAIAGKVPIVFKIGKKTFTHQYELRTKSSSTNRIQGFSPADVMYLIMPDRFSNGNQQNDTIAGMYEGTHRNKPFGRHGGDLKGISNHLDYIKNLGVTAIWLNPVLENNQRRESYHGYAITDLYQVDRRFGSNEEYVSFVNQSHQSGLKVIQDMVANHIGIEHWLMKDLPEKDWIHDSQAKEPMLTSYRTGTPSDPYASQSDLHKMTDGWFVPSMPDINQTNPRFATYLIQNSLWWIEYAGIDGIRMDTYPYPDKEFMAHYAAALQNEYPKFNLVGEAWINSVPMTAYWQKGFKGTDGYVTQLPSVTDFPFYGTVIQALQEEGSWDTGLVRLYMLLGQDFIYPNPNNNVIFLDNHDLTRFFLSIGRDIQKFKLGITLLLTTRGIPQLYYGTELLMDGDGAVHPDVRKDFPGGWPGDLVNAFTSQGRNASQNEAYEHIKKLLDWRKTQSVIHTGKLMHYLPEDNVYVYFRYTANESVMVILNGSSQEKNLSTKRFSERLQSFKQARDIISGENISDLTTLKISAKSSLVLELKQ
ncbi:glycoside hydrolase family 13 protein [Cytophagaceae bacterium YF14B1]|uniref:Glycoside hydrolase family 13 protein n=1 Tax=Xanthocytophaga flava TaxID=3048013 RepID=A0AAE3QRU0_9BACT|nr:glycoside hydrolase family 13 protein [Xanthocytophaga flavus]MDJ1482036.1 glycoside hydrolase family 13 protein [Xanthocytophaga flavus]